MFFGFGTPNADFGGNDKSKVGVRFGHTGPSRQGYENSTRAYHLISPFHDEIETVRGGKDRIATQLSDHQSGDG